MAQRTIGMWLKRLEWFYRCAEIYNLPIGYDIERLGDKPWKRKLYIP